MNAYYADGRDTKISAKMCKVTKTTAGRLALNLGMMIVLRFYWAYFSCLGSAGFIASHGCASHVHTSCVVEPARSSRLVVPDGHNVEEPFGLTTPGSPQLGKSHAAQPCGSGFVANGRPKRHRREWSCGAQFYCVRSAWFVIRVLLSGSRDLPVRQISAAFLDLE